jgi:hypothetical protein
MRCTICQHERRAQIEMGLVFGTSARILANRFQCSPDAIQRHSQRHLTATQRAAIMSAQKPADSDEAARV